MNRNWEKLYLYKTCIERCLIHECYDTSWLRGILLHQYLRIRRISCVWVFVLSAGEVMDVQLHEVWVCRHPVRSHPHLLPNQLPALQRNRVHEGQHRPDHTHARYTHTHTQKVSEVKTYFHVSLTAWMSPYINTGRFTHVQTYTDTQHHDIIIYIHAFCSPDCS